MATESEHSGKVKKFSNYWIVSTFVLAILLLGTLIYGSSFRGYSPISANVIRERVSNFASSQGVDAEIVSVKSDGGLYEVILSIEGEEFPLYVTLDGKNLVPSLVPLEIETQTTQPSVSTQVPKSDKPILELFVMTHCPYGTQAEKGFIPFIEAMGDEVDATIRFVHYFMHEPEETETPRQVCIREEQPDKFIPYLKKFLEEGNYEDALSSAGVDEDAMNGCIDLGRWEDYYAEDSARSQSYGVSGSPTLVVNGVIAQSGRSPASYLTTACLSFNEIPEECNQDLSVATPAPMWGWDSSSASSTSAQC